MSKSLLKLRNSRLGDHAYRTMRNTLAGRGWGGFHKDRIYRALMLDLLNAFEFSSFVETGTFRGHSTELVASRFTKLPVFTTEVVESSYTRSKEFLGRYPNITCILGSSNEVVKKLLDEKTIGPRPLFYLDAHWQSYWPLRDELKHIGDSSLPATIVIDDFEVPGQPQFGFDIDGGGEVTEGLKCNLDYIRPAISPGRTYCAAFPRYSMTDAFASGSGPLRGHIVLFQDMPEEYQPFLDRPLAKQHYFGHGAVAPLSIAPAGQ
jgi:hypothetical protein